MRLRRYAWKLLAKIGQLKARILWTRYYGFFLGSMGKGCVIEKAARIARPDRIFLGVDVEILHSARIEAIHQWGGVRHDPRIDIGDRTSIGPYVHIGAAQSVVVGNDVLMASRVYITDHDHGYDDPDTHVLVQPLKVSPVVIEDFAWLGENVMVLKGVKIGRNAIVGANSVVTTDIPPFAIAVGAPARVIKIRSFGDDSG